MKAFLNLSIPTAASAKTRMKAGAVAGFLAPLLQNDDEGGGVLGWFIDLMKYAGEYLAFVRATEGDPASLKDFVLAKFEETAALSIDEWFQNLASVGPQGEDLLRSILIGASAFALLILVLNLAIWLFSMVLRMMRSDAGVFVEQRKPSAQSVGLHLGRDTLLPEFVIMITPILVYTTIKVIREQLTGALLDLYEPGSIGSTIASLLFQLFEGKELPWFGLFSPVLLLIIGITLFMIAAVILWSVGAAVIGMFQLARYGSGRFLVILTDTILTIAKPLIVLALMVLFFLTGPGLLDSDIMGWLPIAIGFLLWLVVVALTPTFMVLFAFPKLERLSLKLVGGAQNFVAPGSVYVPRQWVLDPENKSPIEPSAAGAARQGASLAAKAGGVYAAVKTGGASTYVKGVIGDRLRKK